MVSRKRILDELRIRQARAEVRIRRARAETYRLASENARLIQQALPLLPDEMSRGVLREAMEYDQRLAEECAPAKLVP
jgi:hypothetical protein